MVAECRSLLKKATTRVTCLARMSNLVDGMPLTPPPFRITTLTHTVSRSGVSVVSPSPFGSGWLFVNRAAFFFFALSARYLNLIAEPVRIRLGYVADAAGLGAEEIEVEASRALCRVLDWVELYEELTALKEVRQFLPLHQCLTIFVYGRTV